MYCAECGTQNEPGRDTCDVCGSPLTERAGSDRCQACGATVEAHDRYCQGCGATLSAPPLSTFEPGPSFVDDDLQNVDPSDLPPWLRDLAAGAPGETPETAGQSTSDTDGLPEWLLATRPGEDTDIQGPGAVVDTAQPAAADSLALIGDDDLPEWLRALGDEEAAADAASAGPGGEGAPKQPVLAEAPTVSRAWLARPRQADPHAVDSARQAFAPVEPEVPVLNYEVVAPAAAPEAVAPDASIPEPREPVVAQADSRRRRVRLLILLLAIVVLAMLVYLLWLGGVR